MFLGDRQPSELRTLVSGKVFIVVLYIRLFVTCLGIMDFMSVAAVISNGCVIAFTSDFITRAVYVYNEGKFAFESRRPLS
jgi:hypothetical protein